MQFSRKARYKKNKNRKTQIKRFMYFVSLLASAGVYSLIFASALIFTNRDFLSIIGISALITYPVAVGMLIMVDDFFRGGENGKSKFK